MDFTMRRIQQIFPSKRCFFYVSLAGALIVSGSTISFASTLASGMLSNTVIQANDDGKSVSQQSDYLYKLARKEIRTGNVEKGKALLQQVLVLDPQNRNAQQELTKLLGLEPGRIALEWISAAEGPRFASVINNFVEQVRKLGPSPLTGSDGRKSCRKNTP